MAGLPRLARGLGNALLIPFTLTAGFMLVFWRILTTFRWGAIVHLARYSWRVVRFGFVGGGIAVFSFVLLLWVWPNQSVLPEHITIFAAGLSYTIPVWVWVTAAITIELNFLGSRYITWRDRRAIGLGTSWFRFHVIRVWTIFFNDVVYQPILLFVFHQPYGLANLAGIIVGSAINYAASDLYVFAAGEKRKPQDHSTIMISGSGFGRGQPKVTIIMPCKNVASEVGDSVAAIMRQSYFLTQGRTVQMYLVGDIKDSSWRGLEGIGLSAPVNVIEVDVRSPNRDTNVKRDVGLRNSNGEIICYLDPDVIPNEHWLANVVWLLTAGGEDAVGGPVVGIRELGKKVSFWSRFIDKTESGSKTPRVNRVVHITSKNASEYKFPVTANFAARRSVLEAADGFDSRYWESLEDYSLMQEILNLGYTIRLDATLEAERHHREGIGPLMREYRRSARGLRHFLALQPQAGFSVLRLAQYAALPPGLLALLAGAYWYPTQTAVLVSAGVISLIQRNVMAARRISGVIYPFIGFWLSLQYVYGLCESLSRYGFRPPERPWVGQVRSVAIVQPPISSRRRR